MRQIREAGKVVRIEYTLEEMSKLLRLEPEELKQWQQALPPSGTDEKNEPLYSISAPADIELLRKKARILRTGVSEKGLAKIEKNGQFEAYAALAEDCPEGMPLQAWRSYALVVLMQAKYNITLTPEELAERANLKERDPETGKLVLGVAMARKHLRLLMNMTPKEASVSDPRPYLKLKDGRWEHQGLPKAWQGR